jgi:hypothetical protein
MMLLQLVPLLFAPLLVQEPASPALLDAAVLRQNGREYSARQVLTSLARWDASLMPTLTNDAEYLRLYLDSPVFAEQVRAFSDGLLLDRESIPPADAAKLEREAIAWSADHGLPADPRSALALAGLEIETRARLIAGQPDEFSSHELRQHMLRSVPEFFGQLQISWIRVPLFDPQTGSVLPEKDRRAHYESLDALGQKLNSSAVTWEDAVKEHSQDPLTRGRGGRVGILDRKMVGRYEEGLLRPLFADLGFRRPEGALLRGPILTSRWAYLVRIEALVVNGVVELEAERPRITRSLREQLLRQHLAELAAGSDRQVLLPLPR